MKVSKIPLKDCLVIEPDIFDDDRGSFHETYNLKKYSKIFGHDINFVQDNHSFSKHNVLRGLHYQKKYPQGKFVRVIRGEVFDVAVDLRKNSTTFGKYYSIVLSEANKKQFWIPPGFAHGFCVLSKFASFEYKCSEYYFPDDEETIIWNDSFLDINWPIENPIISKKDAIGKSFAELFEF